MLFLDPIHVTVSLWTSNLGEFKHNSVWQWRMQDFLKRGSVTVSREARAKKCLRPHPLLIKTTPISDRFRENSCYLSISLFLIETSAKAC